MPLKNPEKPYLLSLGISYLFWGVFIHRYFKTSHKIKLRSFRFLGFKIVFTSYRRLSNLS